MTGILKKIGLIGFVWLLTMPVQVAQARHRNTVAIDTLMQGLFSAAEYNRSLVRHFESDLYTKGKVTRLRSNILIHTVPQINRFQSGVNEYIGETYNKLNFTAPYVFDRHVVAVYGTFPEMHNEANMVMEYFNLSIYRETLLGDHFLSPFVPKNQKFYTYKLESVQGDKAYITYRPKHHNTQLVNGHFVLNTVSHLVEKLSFQGEFEFMKFTMEAEMGQSGNNRYLPAKYVLGFTFSFMGNKYKGHYLAAQHYNSIETIYHEQPQPKKSKYDMTDRYYAQTSDTTHFRTDSLMIAEKRFFPLESDEQQIYVRHAAWEDSILQHPVHQSSWHRLWSKLGDAMISDYHLRNVVKQGDIQCSPILNPLLFQYSKSAGLSYRQEFRYTFDGKNGTYFRVFPSFGYNFTFHQFYYHLISTWEYLPKLSGRFELELGNGKQIYSSAMFDKLKDQSVADIDWDKLKLDYFRDRYVKFRHRFELFNGFEILTGLIYHRRQLVNFKDVTAADPEFQSHYSSFAPRVRIEYTPGQYYYWDRGRKVKVRSNYPTFSLDWERGISGIFDSNGEYERWEFEMDYQHYIDVMRKLSFRIGGGFFSDQKKLYFADFNNFRHSHLPVGWNDGLAGTFQLLDGRYYNSSSRYLRGHITYESPMLALTRLNGLAHFMKSERLYLSALATPDLHPYMEMGWGFATHVIDVGLYASYMNNKFHGAGLHIAFSIFSRQ